MHAAHVSPDGTAGSLEVSAIREVGVAIRILDDGWVRFVGGKLKGCSVFPTANEFCGEFVFAASVPGRMFVEIGAEGCDVLVHLAIHHECSVAGKDVWNGRHRQLAGFIGVAQQQLSGGERRPCTVGHQLALPRLRGSLHSQVIGVAKTIGVAEVFPGGRVAVVHDGSRILRCELDCTARLIEQCVNLRAAGIQCGG